MTKIRIGMYEDQTSEESYKDISEGTAAGPAGGMNAIVALASETHEVTIFHRFNSINAQEYWHNVRWVRVRNDDHLVSFLKEDGSLDVLILRNRPGLIALIEACQPHCPTLIVMLNNDLSIKEFRKACSLGVARFVCRSKSSARHYRFTTGAANVEVIPHRLPHLPILTRQAGTDDIVSGRVMWLGALREEKGFHRVLLAWPIIRRRFPTAELHVFGSVQLHDQAARLGDTKVMAKEFEDKYLLPVIGGAGKWTGFGIHFHGTPEKQEVFRWGQTATVGLVNPNVFSCIETFCISAAELQSVGCPVIGGGAGGLLETISDGNSGFLLHTEAPQELADRVTQILSDPELRNRFAQGACAHAKKFMDIASETFDWRDVIARAMSGARSPHQKYSLPYRFVRGMKSTFVSRVMTRLLRAGPRYS